MIRVLGTATAPAASLAGVLERAVAGGAPAPAWAAAEDPGGAWIRAAAGLPPAERRRGVVGVANVEALVVAARLGVGGALWLPPSLAGGVGALAAAAAAEAARDCTDSGLIDLVACGAGQLVAVSWVNAPFWRQQLGEREMALLLAELAEGLGVLPAVLPWPALLLPRGPTEAEIEAAWRRLTADCHVLSQGVEQVPCDLQASRGEVVAAAVRSLAERHTPLADPALWGFPRPVHELPSGRRVGWWSPVAGAVAAGEGEWVAASEEATDAGYRWRLRARDGTERMVLDGFGGMAAQGAALRVPGWIVGGLSAGSPAGLLVERLATVALRHGLPLWVPNLRSGSLRFLLRLPGTLWVDGAEVPEST